MILSFDSDVLIFAAAPNNELGRFVRRSLDDPENEAHGSMLLLPELLSKPMARNLEREVETLKSILARLELVSVSEPLARLATRLGATHKLRAADAVHLATAAMVGADAFVTNNLKDFRPDEIEEVTVLSPADL